MIHIRDLDFAYEENGFRLRIGELSIAAGERVAWTGPSGSGKTTLLHLVAGILLPTSGRIETCGFELTGQSEGARRNFRIANVGLVFQEFDLLDYLNVLDNILLAYRINRSLRLTSEVRDRAQELAAEVGLEGLLLRRPAQLSHGERQRVAVCRALITNPKLVLADEPTANLDLNNGRRVLDMLDDHVRREKATVLAATHDSEVSQRFDRTIDVSTFREEAQPAGKRRQ